MATKKSPVKKKTKPATLTPSQDLAQQAEMQEFQMWLLQKYGIQDEKQLQMKAQELGDEGIKQEYMLFQQEKQLTQMQAMRAGGLLDKLTNLLSLKQGNKVASKMPVKKIQLKNVSTGTAEIQTAPMKNIDIEAKPIIKRKK